MVFRGMVVRRGGGGGVGEAVFHLTVVGKGETECVLSRALFHGEG